MTSELCKHGMVVCEGCAFERGQMWAIGMLEDWVREGAAEGDYRHSSTLNSMVYAMKDEIEFQRKDESEEDRNDS